VYSKGDFSLPTIHYQFPAFSMQCPFCHEDNDKVIDTRTSDDGSIIRRRRACCSCNGRFTTYERVETTRVRVIKRNGHRVPFDRDKLRNGIERACWKRQISDAQISTLITKVERDIDSAFETEVESHFIGERAMQYLAELDQVAYVRFASVYRSFKDANDFAQEINGILNNPDGDWTLTNRSLQKPPRFPKKKRKLISEE
jgi:transcriptional repressor NrdR